MTSSAITSITSPAECPMSRVFARRGNFLTLFARCAHLVPASSRLFGSPSSFCRLPCRCAVFVQKQEQSEAPVDKYRFSNHLHFYLCTGLLRAIAPIVCVDVF